MSRRKRKLTRKDLESFAPRDPTAKSKYALKLANRRRLARSLGLSDNTTYPEIWAYQEQIREVQEHHQ